MFQVIIIKTNKFDDFKQSLWNDKEKVKEFCSILDTNDLKSTLNSIFNPTFEKKTLDLNTVDVLFTRSHTYQLVYNCEQNLEENYIAGAINYKRKPLRGICVLVKVSLTEISKKIMYKEEPMNIDVDIEFIIQDLFYHYGYKISDKIEEFMFDNKYNVKDKSNTISTLSSFSSYEMNIFGIPFKIWYLEGAPNNSSLSYVKNIGNFLGKKVSEIYITSVVYPQCKCLSLDKKMTQQFIELITTYPDEGELKDISVAYNFVNKNNRSENVYIIFDDFFWKVTKEP